MRRTVRLAVLMALAMLVVVLPAQGQQGPNFNRVTTLRRQVIGRQGVRSAPAFPSALSARGAAQGDPLRPYASRSPDLSPSRSYSSGYREPRRLPQPPTVMVRTTPHTYFPGMRAGQTTNSNVPAQGRDKASRAGLLVPGLMFGGLGLPGTSPALAGPAPRNSSAARSRSSK